MTLLEPSRTRVFVAGGGPVLVAALKAALDQPPNLVVGARPHVVQSSSGLAAGITDLIRNLQPDVVLLTLSRSDLAVGLSAVRDIAEACKNSRILTLLDDLDWLASLILLRAGVSGIFGPGFQRGKLLRAVSLVAAGRRYVDPRISRRGGGFRLSARPGAGSAMTLTLREAEVLHLIAWGYTNKKIAKILNLSTNAIVASRARGMEKLGIKSRIEIINYITASDCGPRGPGPSWLC